MLEGLKPRSPLVPAGVCPDRDLRLAVKELTKKLCDLRITGKFLEGFGTLPFVHAKEVLAVLGIEEDLVRDVARGLRQLLRRGCNFVMELLHTLRVGLEPSANGDNY